MKLALPYKLVPIYKTFDLYETTLNNYLHPTLFWMAQGLIQEYKNKTKRWDKSDVSFGQWKQKNSWEGHIYILRKQIERMATSHPKQSQKKPKSLRFFIL
jgi:hypothetical protein